MRFHARFRASADVTQKQSFIEKNKPAFAGLSEEQLCDGTADGGEDEGRQNDRHGSAATLLFAEEHDIC